MSGSKQALVTSFHGFGDASVTLHFALTAQSSDVLLRNYSINWKAIVWQIIEGMEELHAKYKILHNDLKSDNILFAQTNDKESSCQVVIIDFGKSCSVDCGKLYKLSLKEREQYKNDHPQIAPDVRDGANQSVRYIFAWKKIVFTRKLNFKDCSKFHELIEQCMVFDSKM